MNGNLAELFETRWQHLHGNCDLCTSDLWADGPLCPEGEKLRALIKAASKAKRVQEHQGGVVAGAQETEGTTMAHAELKSTNPLEGKHGRSTETVR
jgi:hypothetical protein